MKKIFAVILIATLMLAASSCVCLALGEGEGEPGIFTIFYEKAMAHSGEILSALAFIGSFVIAITYKKGLLPLIKGALSALGNGVSSMRAQAEKSIEESKDAIVTLGERLNSTEELIESLGATVGALSDKLRSANETAAENERARILMESQVDLLYEIFMTSSLPQYAKDQVGERIAKMRAELQGAEKSEG